MASFPIGPTDRILIVGTAGSGKSTLARALTSSYRNLVSIDSKHEESLPRSITVYSPAEFAQVYPQRSTRVLFRPDASADRGADVGAVLARVERYGSTAVVLHEAMFYATSDWIVPELRRLQVAGRSRSIPVWACSQRPIDLHNVMLSEARHVFVFDLLLEGDRRKVAGIAGPDAMNRPEREFGFGYYGPTTAGVMVRCSPLEVERAPSDNRESGPGHDHVDGRDLHRQGAYPDVQRAGPERPRRRDLAG